jgi:hypothetical protein
MMTCEGPLAAAIRTSGGHRRNGATDPCATWQIDDGFRFAQPILRIRRWNIGAAVITSPL